MKWGRKKSSLISRVFAISWLSKLRDKSVISDQTSAKKQQKGKWDLPSPSSLAPASCKHGSLCSTDYVGEKIQGRMSTGGINSILYDSDDEIDFPVRGFQSFDDTVLDIKRMKEKQHVVRFQDGDTKFTRNDENSRRSNRRVLKEKRVELEKWSNKEEKSSTLAEKDILEIAMKGKDFRKSTGSNERRQHKFSLHNSNLSTIRENRGFWTLNLDDFNETSKKISSSECQELKKARKKSKMKTKEKVVEGRPVFDSFAVVKTSFDPRKDFRDSMVEMIVEKGIQRPEELEELLACYLQLNCDEYHDLIIKVFRQVWFDMNSPYIDPAIHNDHCFGNY